MRSTGARRRIDSHPARTAFRAARTSTLITVLTTALISTLFITGCQFDDGSGEGAEEGAGWVGCGVPACSLRLEPGVRLIEDADGRRLIHEASGARVDIGYGNVRLEPGYVDAVITSAKQTLSPAVDWHQAPQAEPGFLVRGVSGSARPAPGVIIDPDPLRVYLATYESPGTGSVLVLRVSADSSSWDEGWAALGSTVTRVGLRADF